MIIPRIIPCLLLRGAGLYKTIKFKSPKYVGDPINAVRIFNEKEVDELLVLDIEATSNGHPPQFDLIREIAGECFMPMGYGGGITNIEQIEALFSAGLEKVVINSAAHVNLDLITDAAKRFGSQSIVVSIDVHSGVFGKYTSFSHSGARNRKVDPVTHAKRMEEAGAGELVLNSMDRDGTQKGYDLKLIAEVTSSVGVPVVAVGGAGRLEHFREAHDAGASALSAGSFFVFHGKHRAVLITYPEHVELEQLFRVE